MYVVGSVDDDSTVVWTPPSANEDDGMIMVERRGNRFLKF